MIFLVVVAWNFIFSRCIVVSWTFELLFTLLNNVYDAHTLLFIPKVTRPRQCCEIKSLVCLVVRRPRSFAVLTFGIVIDLGQKSRLWLLI